MDIGIDLSSLTTRVVTRLAPGSRAELAGLQDGDKILKTSGMGYSLKRFRMHVQYVVERNGGQEIEGRYWPRSFDTVSSFQLAEQHFYGSDLPLLPLCLTTPLAPTLVCKSSEDFLLFGILSISQCCRTCMCSAQNRREKRASQT